jgi:hypothetical protein
MATESWVLDGLSVTSGTDLRVEDVEFAPGKKLIELVTSPNADGGVLLTEPRTENAVLSWRLRVPQQPTTDGALAKLGLLVDKLEEASKHDDGLALVWTPQDSAQSYTLYVLAGQVTGLPMKLTGSDAGWFLRSPVVTIETVCKPFLYLPEALLGSATSSDPLVTVTLAGVKGDVPAEGRLVVTDAASQARRHVEWGLEQRHYNAATSLIRDSASMTTSGFAGTTTTRTGAYSSNGVIRATLYTQPIAVAGTGALSHVGTFRIKARVWATTTDVRMRLAWQNGDGPFSTNPWVAVHAEDAFVEVDLGTIHIDPAASGTQQWAGRIEAYHPTSTTDTIDVDYLEIIPAGEGYGKARAAYQYQPGVIVGRDEFTGTTSGANLGGRVAPAGGTWATSGATTDFTFADLAAGLGWWHGGAEEMVGRFTTSDTGPRYAILGTTNHTNLETGVLVWRGVFPGTPASRQGLVARWVDASNHLLLYQEFTAAGTNLNLASRITGVETLLASVPIPTGLSPFRRLRLIAYASGLLVGTLHDVAGAELLQVTAQSSDAATGGTLAAGETGIYDVNSNTLTTTRYYDDFYVSTPAAEPIVIYSGQSAEIRASGPAAQRENSAGTAYGDVQSYQGARPWIPAAGDENRSTRIAVKARRADVDVAADANIADSTTVQVYGRPRFRIPRGPV